MLDRAASWENQKEIMYNGLASKGYIWMDWDELKKVENELKKYPDDYYLTTAKGILYFNQDHNIALECFSKALSMKPFDPHQYYNRGRMHLSLDECIEGVADLEASVKLDPDDGWKWHFLALAYYLLGRYEKALENFLKAVEVLNANEGDLESCEAYYLFCTYMKLGKPEEAWQWINTITPDTYIVPVIGDDDLYMKGCLVINQSMSVEDFIGRIGDGEAKGVYELYNMGQYYYYVENNLEKANEWLDKCIATGRKSTWCYKMAVVDKRDWNK